MTAPSTTDLRSFVTSPGPYFTIVIPTPSRLDDARHQFEVNWRNAVGRLGDDWPADELSAVDDLVAALPHDGGEALIVVHALNGPTLLEFIAEPVKQSIAAEGVAPRLTTIIEARQRLVPHVVVETDRAGADVHAFDGGEAIGTDHVDGDTEHIHRGHPGGWSQRRFQQRAENTWERNADDIAAAVADVDERVGAELVFVAGDVRAQALVLESLPERVQQHAVKVEVGSPEGIADEVVRLVADHVARRIRDLAEHVKNRLGTGTSATDPIEVMEALAAGRVEHLLVHDDGTDGTLTTKAIGGVPAGARVVDAAVVAGLRSDAAVTIVPRLAFLDGPIAALLRW